MIRADLFCVLAGCLETVIASSPQLSAYGFSRRDELGEELRIKFGGPTVPQQPHELPPAPLLITE